VRLNGYFVDRVNSEPNLFEIVTPPSLSLTVFRIIPDFEASEEELNELNKLFFRKMTARADIMLTQTDLNGLYCTRWVPGIHVDDC
jgi:aromatic-L-amino-acid/L-tryptophan decarboxylase